MSAALLEALAHAAASLGGAAVLMLALALPLARRPAQVAGLAAAQAVGLALVLLAQAWLWASWELLAVAVGTLALKAVALPRGARALAPAVGDASLAPGFAVVAAVLAALVLALASPVMGAVPAMALAMVLAGALAAALRRDALARIGGVMVLENGLVLAMAVVPGLPGVSLLALATLALPAAAVLALLRRVLPADGGEAAP